MEAMDQLITVLQDRRSTSAFGSDVFTTVFAHFLRMMKRELHEYNAKHTIIVPLESTMAGAPSSQPPPSSSSSFAATSAAAAAASTKFIQRLTLLARGFRQIVAATESEQRLRTTTTNTSTTADGSASGGVHYLLSDVIEDIFVHIAMVLHHAQRARSWSGIMLDYLKALNLLLVLPAYRNRVPVETWTKLVEICATHFIAAQSSDVLVARPEDIEMARGLARLLICNHSLSPPCVKICGDAFNNHFRHRRRMETPCDRIMVVALNQWLVEACALCGFQEHVRVAVEIATNLIPFWQSNTWEFRRQVIFYLYSVVSILAAVVAASQEDRSHRSQFSNRSLIGIVEDVFDGILADVLAKRFVWKVSMSWFLDYGKKSLCEGYAVHLDQGKRFCSCSVMDNVYV